MNDAKSFIEPTRGLRLRAQQNPWQDRTSFMLLDYERKAVAEPAVMKVQEPHVYIEHPDFFRLDRDACQVLMDDLWTCGIRPTEGQGSAGQLAAVQKHLEDMRRLAFHPIGIKL